MFSLKASNLTYQWGRYEPSSPANLKHCVLQHGDTDLRLTCRSFRNPLPLEHVAESERGLRGRVRRRRRLVPAFRDPELIRKHVGQRRSGHRPTSSGRFASCESRTRARRRRGRGRPSGAAGQRALVELVNADRVVGVGQLLNLEIKLSYMKH